MGRSGGEVRAERCEAQDEFHGAAHARAWADGDFDAIRGFGLDGVRQAARLIRAGCELAPARRAPRCVAAAAAVRARAPCV
jgi:hypothetical protein